MLQHKSASPVEHALQEFEVDQLEDLDVPGWSDYIATASAVLSTASAISLVAT